VHLTAELLKYRAQVDIVHVPYRGAAAAMSALVAGDVDMLVDSLPPSLPHIRAGRARPLAVTTPERVPQLPDVPTMIEAGFPGFEVWGWSGVATTAGFSVRTSTFASHVGKNCFNSSKNAFRSLGISVPSAR